MPDFVPPEVEEEKEPEDLGNPKHVQARNRELRLAYREAAEDLKILLSTASGRRWMWKFLSRLGPFRTPFGPNTHMSYFAGGEQNVALELIAEIIATAPEIYTMMQKENPDG